MHCEMEKMINFTIDVTCGKNKSDFVNLGRPLKL